MKYILLAILEWTILGTLNANATYSKILELEKGKTTIEVTANDKVSCRFMMPNFEQVNQQNTTHCLVNTDLKESNNMVLTVTNETNKRVDFKISVHPTK